ncbi:MAG: hypothetical protein PUD07_03080 [bacterium]|nr:hypothetical protein [bacterium]
MIIIKKHLKTIKYLGIFILTETFLAFFLGFINLLGVSSYITNLLSFLFNITLFFILSFKKGKTTNKKGYIEGLINGFLLVLCLFIFTLIFFIKNISIYTILYYLILISTSIIASILGKNTKKENK